MLMSYDITNAFGSAVRICDMTRPAECSLSRFIQSWQAADQSRTARNPDLAAATWVLVHASVGKTAESAVADAGHLKSADTAQTAPYVAIDAPVENALGYRSTPGRMAAMNQQKRLFADRAAIGFRALTCQRWLGMRGAQLPLSSPAASLALAGRRTGDDRGARRARHRAGGGRPCCLTGNRGPGGTSKFQRQRPDLRVCLPALSNVELSGK